MDVQGMSQEEKELRLKKLGDQMDAFMQNVTEENFDERKLDSLLREFNELCPIPGEDERFDPEKGLERFRERLRKAEARRYSLFYDMIIAEQERLKRQDATGNYRLCKALAACYELQEYLANILAEYPEKEQ